MFIYITKIFSDRRDDGLELICVYYTKHLMTAHDVHHSIYTHPLAKAK